MTGQRTLCEEDCLVADAVVLMLPGVLSLPGITLPSIELLPCWKKKHSHLPLPKCVAWGWSSTRPLLVERVSPTSGGSATF